MYCESELDEYERKIIEQIQYTNSHQIDFSNSQPLDVAQKVFGFKGFKENGQEEIIKFFLEKKGNAIGIMPTGGGKSACFQIPALIQKNMTLVVSPLIALMKDQVESLVKVGVHSAFFINSSINNHLKEQIISLVKDNKVKILYIAPESLRTEKIQSILSKAKIDLIVIDEAHCISTWGHNFRPEYLKLAEIIESLNSPPVLALTATATKEVIKDIKIQLKREFKTFKASFDRPLLYIAKQDIPDNANKEKFLLSLIRKLKGPTIVFARTHDLTENLAELLNNNGIKSLFYHAGLNSEERQERQNLFMNGGCDIIIATIAFGMGIDKKDIRNVIHYNIPQSIEGYYQEIGRAGRDGNKSNCILLYSEGDIRKIKALISADWPDKEKIKDLINHLKNKTTNFVFTSTRSLEFETDIKEIPIKLILHRLEEAKVIKQYPSVIHKLKIVFNKDYEQIISLSDKRYIQDLRRIFNSESFKNSRSIINLEKLVDETGLNYFKINDILKYLINRNLMKVLREEHKDLIQINKEINSFNVSPLVELFKEVLNKSYQKVDELVECFNSQTCIRKSILTYFDEPQLKETCKMCSNCIAYEIIKQIPIEINENYASDEEINKIGEQILDIEHDEFHVLLLKAIGIDRYIPEKDFVNILKGKLHRFSAKWKFNLNSYGLLKDKEDSEIDEIVNKLISDSLVEITPEGILRLTKKGINYLEKDEKHFINVESSQKIRKDKKELFCESCGKQIKHRGKCLSCNIKVKINKLKIF